MSDRQKSERSEKSLWQRLRRLFRKKPTPPPADPYAYKMAPVGRGPKGRSGAAVAELEDDSYRSYPPRQT